MKALPAAKIIKILENNGFVLMRQRGSHMIWRNKNTGCTVPVPLHGRNKPIHIATFLNIIRQSKLPKKLFGKE